jgi:hypothetical protein
MAEKNVRIANRAARSLWRIKTVDNKNTRPIPAQIKKTLVDELKRNNFTNVSSTGDIFQIIVHFTTPEGKKCHITLHTGGVTDKEGAAGAFHIKIEDTPPTFGKSGAKEPTYRYYRFEPFVVTINGKNILHFRNISYTPRETSVHGATKPLINSPNLNTHMQTVMGLLNSVNIPMGTSPDAPAPSKKQEAAAPAVFAAANDEEEEEYAASVVAARLKKEQSRTVPETWEEEADNNGNKPNKPKGGRRNQTKKRKINRRRNRTRRN